jgi:proteasome activator subunit 4
MLTCLAVQVLEDEPLSLLKSPIEKLLNQPEQHKQRAAAELLAAIIGGA